MRACDSGGVGRGAWRENREKISRERTKSRPRHSRLEMESAELQSGNCKQTHRFSSKIARPLLARREASDARDTAVSSLVAAAPAPQLRSLVPGPAPTSPKDSVARFLPALPV